MCRGSVNQFRDVSAREPVSTTFQMWQRGTLNSDVFRRGVEAIEWTAEERGLAGLERPARVALGDVNGGILRGMGRNTHVAGCPSNRGYHAKRSRAPDGGTAELGSALSGSQKSLVPDLVIERDDVTVVVDAKYKEHWEEMRERRGPI